MNKLIIFISLFISINGFCASGKYKGVSYTLEPFYGRGKSSVGISGVPRVWEYYYGVRASAQFKMVHFEGTYTKTDRGVILTSKTSATVQGYGFERIRGGFVASWRFTTLTRAIGRLGGEAKSVSRYTLVDGSINEDKGDYKINPYLGVGIEVGARIVSLTANVTVSFNDFPENLEDNDYLLSGGIKFRY
ncbi:MAG: hypothetical protein ISR65_07075 [Bacteriovoracaceae bacterium]|nr:hypothetical protein [Bacteriovoracaceae bacterium]